MKAELEDVLLTEFKDILNLEHEKIQYGKSFRCESGWFVLIYDFLQKVKASGEDVRFGCVKEKYGWVRFYPDHTYMQTRVFSEDLFFNPVIEAMLQEVEKKSYKTCEFCGESGIIRWDYAWIRVLCDKCESTYPNYSSRRDNSKLSDQVRTYLAP